MKYINNTALSRANVAILDRQTHGGETKPGQFLPREFCDGIYDVGAFFSTCFNEETFKFLDNFIENTILICRIQINTSQRDAC